jgi:hypothetical protein
MLKINLKQEFGKIKLAFSKMKNEIAHKSFILHQEQMKLQKEVDFLKVQIEELKTKLEIAQLQKEKYIANTKTKKVHAENCPHAKKIDFNHKMIFTSLQKAQHAEYELCSCLK